MHRQQSVIDTKISLARLNNATQGLFTFSEFVRAHLDLRKVSAAQLSVQSVQGDPPPKCKVLLPFLIMVQCLHRFLVDCNKAYMFLLNMKLILFNFLKLRKVIKEYNGEKWKIVSVVVSRSNTWKKQKKIFIEI